MHLLSLWRIPLSVLYVYKDSRLATLMGGVLTSFIATFTVAFYSNKAKQRREGGIGKAQWYDIEDL